MTNGSQQKYSIQKMLAKAYLKQKLRPTPRHLNLLQFYVRELLPPVTHSSQEVRCSVWRVCLDSIIPGISVTEKT